MSIYIKRNQIKIYDNGVPILLDGLTGAKGDKGTDGYTPVKGVDYFDGVKGDKGDPGKDGTMWNPTDAEKQEIANKILNTAPSAIAELKEEITDISAEIGFEKIYRGTAKATASWVKAYAFSNVPLKSGVTYKITFIPSETPTVSSYGFLMENSSNTEIRNVRLQNVTSGVIEYTPTEDKVVRVAVSFGDANTHSVNCTLEIKGHMSEIDIHDDLINMLEADLDIIKNKGRGLVDYGFAHGTLANGVYNPDILFRVSTPNDVVIPYDMTIKADDGFHFALHVKDGSTYVDKRWQTELFVKKGTVCRIMIGRLTDVSTEIANIREYASSINTNTYVSDKMETFDEILGTSKNAKNTVKTSETTAFVRSRVFTGVDFKAFSSYVFHFDYDAIPTGTGYLYILNSDGSVYKEVSILKNSINSDYILTTTEDLLGANVNIAYSTLGVEVSVSLSPIKNTVSYNNGLEQKAVNESLPQKVTIVGHAGAYSGVYPENSIENAMYCVKNFGYKSIEVDVKFTSDNVPVLEHEQTVVHDGVTYRIDQITYEQAISFGLKPFEPFLVCSHRYGFELVIDTAWTNAQFDAFYALLKSHGTTNNIIFITNGANIESIKYALSKDRTLNIGLIYFSKPSNLSDLYMVRNLSVGNVMIDMEIGTAINTTDIAYINEIRMHDISIGVFTIYNRDADSMITEWSDIADYITTTHQNANDLVDAYVFP